MDAKKRKQMELQAAIAQQVDENKRKRQEEKKAAQQEDLRLERECERLALLAQQEQQAEQEKQRKAQMEQRRKFEDPMPPDSRRPPPASPEPHCPQPPAAAAPDSHRPPPASPLPKAHRPPPTVAPDFHLPPPAPPPPNARRPPPGSPAPSRLESSCYSADMEQESGSCHQETDDSSVLFNHHRKKDCAVQTDELADDLTRRSRTAKRAARDAAIAARPEWGSNQADTDSGGRKRIPNSQRDPRYEQQRVTREARIARRRDELQQLAQAPKLHTAMRGRQGAPLPRYHLHEDWCSDSEAASSISGRPNAVRRVRSGSPRRRQRAPSSPPIPAVQRRQQQQRHSPLPSLRLTSNRGLVSGAVTRRA
ncbi:PREDICTED: serine/arginine repetitive matrix protein 1-like [Priapulus caudatus]|uniref:Serine/arginine repetitive matrix protein 1-like n=1 Tax=Priapulus caudatus TaxID=37621 RepID=A0ABM1EF82_PRICU|nr:PREDICTED: serine/arginine repetitive matrix protein 1-like [Priapulus caudatus]